MASRVSLDSVTAGPHETSDSFLRLGSSVMSIFECNLLEQLLLKVEIQDQEYALVKVLNTQPPTALQKHANCIRYLLPCNKSPPI